MGNWEIHQGDVFDVLKTLPSASVHCVVTSPPYWGLRDYGIPARIWGGDPDCRHRFAITRVRSGHPDRHTEGKDANGNGAFGTTRGQQGAKTARGKKIVFGEMCRCGAWRGSYGLEPTPEMYVEHTLLWAREVHRILRPDGVMWLNMGDCYAADGKWGGETGGKQFCLGPENRQRCGREKRHTGLKPKDVVGMPWRVAFALQQAGWWWRAQAPWIKRNPLPESTKDRPGRGIEEILLFSKSARYFYDGAAVRVPATGNAHARGNGVYPKAWCEEMGSVRTIAAGHKPRPTRPRANESFCAAVNKVVSDRHRRDVDWFLQSWEGMMLDGHGLPLAFVVNPRPYKEAHFATFPPKLVEPMILSGTSAYGCCARCGAPWERQQKKRKTRGHSWNNHVQDLIRGQRDESNEFKGQNYYRNIQPSITTGWAPSCHCQSNDPCATYLPPVPCTVLDPFAGSGTVGQVARQLGRKFIGIEIKPEYVRLAHRRIRLHEPMIDLTESAPSTMPPA